MLEIIYNKLLEDGDYINKNIENINSDLNLKLVEYIKKKDKTSVRLISQKISKIQNILRIKLTKGTRVC